MKQEVHKEIVRQARAQVDEQIKDTIPTPLEIQLKENQRQKAAVDVSLYNSSAIRISVSMNNLLTCYDSKSRIKNATLDVSSQDEPIEPVLTENGERSQYFPATLRTLFSYNRKRISFLIFPR